MLCQTIKKDKDCFFWGGDRGCTFTDGACRTVLDDKCDGCDHVEEWPTGKYCTAYPAPNKQWALGLCNMATHVKIEEEQVQKTLNPLKASKRGAGRR